MSVSKEIDQLLDGLVLSLFREDERLRYSVRKLSARIWTNQLGGIEKIKEMSAYKFLLIYTHESEFLYTQESIGRSDRKVKEMHPELRVEKQKWKQDKELQAIVLDLLKEDERLRDSDKKLSARIWANKLGGVNELKEMSAYDFLVMYSDKSKGLYCQERIGRARRRVQNANVDLRGAEYKERKDEVEEVKRVVRR